MGPVSNPPNGGCPALGTRLYLTAMAHGGPSPYQLSPASQAAELGILYIARAVGRVLSFSLILLRSSCRSPSLTVPDHVAGTCGQARAGCQSFCLVLLR